MHALRNMSNEKIVVLTIGSFLCKIDSFVIFTHYSLKFDMYIES